MSPTYVIIVIAIGFHLSRSVRVNRNHKMTTTTPCIDYRSFKAEISKCIFISFINTLNGPFITTRGLSKAKTFVPDPQVIEVTEVHKFLYSFFE